MPDHKHFTDISEEKMRKRACSSRNKCSSWAIPRGMFDHVLFSTMAARNPASLIVFVMSKCNHTPESRTYITVNDEQQIKDILRENNERMLLCAHFSCNIDTG